MKNNIIKIIISVYKLILWKGRIRDIKLYKIEYIVRKVNNSILDDYDFN